MTQDVLTITRPDDWHLHVRDGDLMASVIGATAKQFATRDHHAQLEATRDDS